MASTPSINRQGDSRGLVSELPVIRVQSDTSASTGESIAIVGIGEEKLMTPQREQIDEGTARWAHPESSRKTERWQTCTNFCDSRSVTTGALD
jgi:hypothetical protein